MHFSELEKNKDLIYCGIHLKHWVIFIQWLFRIMDFFGFFTYSTLYVWDPDHILLLWTNDDVFETQSFYFINQFIITFWHEGTESVNPLRPRSTPSGSQGLFCWSKSCLSILMRLKICKFGMYFKCWTTCRFVVEVIITFNILKIVWDQKPRPRPKLETQI